MKKKSLIATGLVLLLQAHVLALDTLHLNVQRLNRISLVFNNEALVNAPLKIAPGATWILKITNPANAKITLGNTQGQITPIELENNILEIKNNVLTGKNFTLQKTIRLRVLDNNENIARTFLIQIDDANAAAGNAADPNPNTPQNAAFTEHMPGSMVYDAIKLAQDEAITSKEQKREILRYYARGEEVTTAFAGNKFLQPVIDSVKTLISAQSAFGISSILASVGGLDVTKYADGLAKFLVKRAKQELSVAFFEKFSNIIDSTPDLATVFPSTTVLLRAIGVEVYDYERYIQNLREAFKADIVVIHRNLPGIVNNHPAFFNTHRELKAALLSGCYIATELENQSHPGDILANFPIEFLDSLRSKNFSGALQTLQVLSASLRDTTQGEEASYWVPIKALRQLVENQLALKFYLGLVYHEAKTRYGSIPFEGTNLVELLDKVADQYDNGVRIYTAYKRYILRFAEKTEALNQMIQEYSELPTDSAALEKYAKYLRSAVDFLQYCTQASTLPLINEKVKNLDSLFSKYFQVAYSSSDLLADISKKNYSAAINDLVRIYNLVRVKPLQDNLTDKRAASNSVIAQNRLAKYGSFMATVATAKTPDEVAKAIEAAALPVGSSRVKRETTFNVALNAYVGPYIGYEKIRGVDSGKINAYGITAPIGFSVSKGYSILFFNSNHRSSSSIFFSLIDLGAVTAFRFTNDSTEKVPTIELKDIFSPGIFYSHGFGRTPISLNIGYQVGPLLRRVRLDENEYGKTYSRISVSLCVDIPVFNLYSRPR